MAIKLTEPELEKLRGVNEKLVRVLTRAIELGANFHVLEGVRDIATQRKYFAAGVTHTLKSKHLEGRAVDIAPIVDGKPTFKWPPYYPLAELIKHAAEIEKVRVEWGGDWRSFKDGPHWQLLDGE